MTKTPMDKNTEQQGRVIGAALLNGGWTPELRAKSDYLSACWGKLLAPSGLFTGKPNPAREQELGDLMEAGVYRSLYDLETKGTEGDAIFAEMRAQIAGAKAMKDPVVKYALEQLLRIGREHLGLLNNYNAPGNLYDRKEPLPAEKDSAAA